MPGCHAPTLSKDGVYALCMSLNSPVVHSDRLPLGPTRAAIACHAGSAGPALTVILRSQDGEQTLVFGWEGSLGGTGKPAANLALAMSFAESLGFLFDEDLVAAGDPAEAVARWQQFSTLGDLPASELLLDQEIVECATPDEPAAESSIDTPAAREGAPRVLSKFRRVARSLDREAKAVAAELEMLDARCAPSDEGAAPLATAFDRLLACF